jgi:mono/diheme cytochrome c family protein
MLERLPVLVRARASLLLFALSSVAALGCLGCESPPSAGSLKEWTPADHHSTEDDRAGQGQVAQGQRQPAGSDVPQLVELAWRQQCSNCHGPMGKGDGQMGPMLRAPDLTNEALQAKATDAELYAIIKGGRDKMPAFGNLPDPVLQGLVARIRQLRGH